MNKNIEKSFQTNNAAEVMTEVPIPDHKKGWMSANAIARVLEDDLGDKVFWEKSDIKGIPNKKNKVQAIVSVHAVRLLAQKYLGVNPALSEIQRNKTQTKEQYAPELIKALIKEIKNLKGRMVIFLNTELQKCLA